MPASYAKTRAVAQALFSLALFSLVLFLPLLLAGCGGMAGYNPLPWDGGGGAVVTKDPGALPDMAWQTPVQRQVLTRRNEDFARRWQQQYGGAGGRISPPVLSAAQDPVQTDPALPAHAGGKTSVALLLPLSGKEAALGQSLLNAAQMALFDVGATGLELMPRDTQSTPAGAAAAARKARAEGADLILGPVFSEDLRAVKTALAGGPPVISFTTDWTQAGSGTYVMGFLPFVQVRRVMHYAQGRGLRRFAVYAPQTEYADIVVRAAQESGADVVRTGRYAPMQSDLAALVEDFVDQGGGGTPDFDALLLPAGGEGLRSIVSLLDAAGLRSGRVRFIGTGLWDDAALNSDPALYGGWYAAPDPELRRDFETRYLKNYGKPPARIASLAYDAMAMAAVLAHAQNGGDPFGRDRLTSPRGFAGIDGIFRFRPDGLPERGLAVLEIQSGKPRVIDPAPTAFISSGS